ncbi:DUF1496 domain-containing protein [Duganella sp. LjRoot269]|uniref:DUF1496 domain-containing protein n=1 Tax=Duganella sp. LjRoot269 TaxID=3342305 RepID=UPI003ECFFB1F
MKFKIMFVAAMSTGFAVSASSAYAEVPSGNATSTAGSQRYCLYQDQKYSEGWVQSGMVCTRGRVTSVINGTRDDTRPAEFMWTAQEKPGLAILYQEIERARLQTQLIQARIALMEAEAKQNDIAFKKSDKN